MIDAGSDINGIKTLLDTNAISFDDVKWVLITHSDHDHTASLPLFRNAEIYMSEDEINLINKTVKRNFFSYNRLPINIDELILLQNNQELLFDNVKVQCIKTAGHTSGSMSYIIDDKYLFTGDAFQADENGISIHPFTMDKESGNKSITLLQDLISNNDYVVFTSHYGYYENIVFK